MDIKMLEISSLVFFSTAAPLSLLLHKQKKKILRCMEINKNLRQKAQKVIVYDDTTMAYNYAYFVRQANRIIIDARKKKDAVSLLVVDIDELENINIRFGFRTGDKTLNLVHETTRRSLRADDIVGRFGGSGFFVLLYGCDAEGVAAVIDKIKSELGGKRVFGPREESVSFTVKYSSSTARGRVAQLGKLIENAEEATHRVKQEKLFCVVTDHNGHPVLTKKEPVGKTT